MDPLIKAKNLNFTYNVGRDNEFQALINVNIDVFPEEFIIIFGPSGCGKSTLLNVIAGLETPTEGEVLVAGKDITKMTKKEFSEYHRSEIGMIYQAYNLITSLKVIENVALPQLFLDVGKNKRENRALDLLERFGVKQQAAKIPTELSGGQQQRIGIARAIVNNPAIVLADEPVGNLDSISAKNVLDILKELNEQEKKTVVMVTHNPENLIYGDRIIHMKDGMITREVVNRQKQKKTERELAKPPTSEIENLMRAYQGLTPEQINILIMPYKAKLFAHHFITTRNMDETKVFEDTMQRRLLNSISEEDFYDSLHRSADEGGVGFNRRTAEKVMRRINRSIRMAFFIYRKHHQYKDDTGKHPKITLEEKADKLTDYLLKSCYGKYCDKLGDVARLRLKQATRDRLATTINKSDYFRILDLAFKDGGVGLNSKTARAISEEIELILILGYGVSLGLGGSTAYGSFTAPMSVSSAGGGHVGPASSAPPVQALTAKPAATAAWEAEKEAGGTAKPPLPGETVQPGEAEPAVDKPAVSETAPNTPASEPAITRPEEQTAEKKEEEDGVWSTFNR